MKAYIKAISYYLPTATLDNEEINTLFPEWSVFKIAEKTGIQQRTIAAPNEFSSDMGISAANKLFEEHAIDRNEIDFILFCTQSPDHFLPTTACIIQDKLGIPITAGALDFNLGCSGFIYGLSLAKGLIETGIAKNVLFITAETYSKFIHPSDKGVRTIFGDAAAATLLSADPGDKDRIGPFVLGTDGKGAEKLIVKNGGMRHAYLHNDTAFGEDSVGNFKSSDHLYMKGSDIFIFTLVSVPKLCEDLLHKANTNYDEIDLVIFHQANKHMLEALRKKINIPAEKFYIFIANCGNTVSSTIPIALYEAMKDGKAKKGDRVMLVGFGVGYSYGGTIVTI
jgi:3-oxoacyl-[acyl-carrier-protein] synthase-3